MGADADAELKGVPPMGLGENEALAELRAMAKKNKVFKSYLGQGFHATKTPPVIQRNMLENPAWYTAYTPYQAEISQGRLEMLLNFQTMVIDLTGMEVSNCSLLDEASAAGEAVNMCHALDKGKRKVFFVADDVHPSTIGVVRTRAENMGVKVVVGDARAFLSGAEDPAKYCGVLLQYPNTYGSAGVGKTGEAEGDIDALAAKLKAKDTKLVVATDLLACAAMRPPGEFGADIVVGSAQRFGVPMFFGGPHAGYMATKQAFVRQMPGRIIGVTKDAQGRSALRMALQTREQFIRRDKATSNICTAQALLANMAAAYGIYHGPEGLKAIALDVATKARRVAAGAAAAGFVLENPKAARFDTVTLAVPKSTTADAVVRAAAKEGINVRLVDAGKVAVSVDEATSEADVAKLVQVFAAASSSSGAKSTSAAVDAAMKAAPVTSLGRTSPFMLHPVFHSHRSETQMMRYLASLAAKDYTLCQGMIPLGSCTMKLNAAAELMPVSWPEFADMHPFAPEDQTEGYRELITRLNAWLASLTGFDAVSTQPNSGATGEYAGLLCIKRYHESRGQGHRNVCLIPASAHGTNPASAAMCNMKIVGVKNAPDGSIDFDDLVAKAKEHAANLSCLMCTYPATYGLFEERIKEVIDVVHQHGGQVYMDGANFNAQVGYTSPGRIGADVCHLNLHKTFAIPHGGGGPGVGPIGVRAHLAPFLPGNAVVAVGGEGKAVAKKSSGGVAAAPFGSAGILPIPYQYIRMMGGKGLKQATAVAILNANYMAKRLEKAGYKILYRGANGLSAHEFIIDCSELTKYGLDEGDIAKRLMDAGFHAPTMSWPVHHSMMVEPTESEDKAECDRFVNALIAIKREIDEVASGKVKAEDSPLRHAPHTAAVIASDKWDRAYSRQQGAFFVPPPLGVKYWPSVGRVDHVLGDRNLVCACPPVEAFLEAEEAAAAKSS